MPAEGIDADQMGKQNLANLFQKICDGRKPLALSDVPSSTAGRIGKRFVGALVQQQFNDGFMAFRGGQDEGRAP